jgi:serine/threonine protein kinase
MGPAKEKVTYGGTPAFMAPELFLTDTNIEFGKTAGIDVFALGATLYFLVVGRPPWMGKNQIELAYNISKFELTFPVKGIDPHLVVRIFVLPLSFSSFH